MDKSISIEVSIKNVNVWPSTLNSRIDYQLSIPNKPIEYLANNLPILSSLKGELHKLIESNFIGYNYDNGIQLSKIINAQLLEKNMEDLIKNTKNI